MINKFTNNIIQLYLNNYSKRYYLRELARKLKKPHQTIKPYLKLPVLIEEKRGKIIEYYLNLKSPLLLNYLTIAEQDKLINLLEKDILLKTLYQKLLPNFKTSTFIIFGSATRSTKEANDIDLLAITKDNIKSIIKEFEEIYSKKIHLIQINEISDLSTSLKKEIYKNHLILNNTEEIIRYFIDQYEKNQLV